MAALVQAAGAGSLALCVGCWTAVCVSMRPTRQVPLWFCMAVFNQRSSC